MICIVAIAVSVAYTVWPRGRRGPAQADPRRLWVCEACDHRFTEPPAIGVRRCAKCGEAAAVQSVVYVCGECGGSFEAYRLKDYSFAGSATDERGQPILPVAYRKTPGGTWTSNFAQLDAPRCPKCDNADAATLTPKEYEQ